MRVQGGVRPLSLHSGLVSRDMKKKGKKDRDKKAAAAVCPVVHVSSEEPVGYCPENECEDMATSDKIKAYAFSV